MSGPKTISEALTNLPSSSSSSTLSFQDTAALPTSSGRRLLITKKKKFPTSASAEAHKPTKLQWTRQQQHIRHPGSNQSLGTDKQGGKVKEAILIAGRNDGVKQALKFNCSLPLPFLEQNGRHYEDLGMDIDDDDDGLAGEGAGGGLTASDLEMDMGDDEQPGDEEGDGGLTLDFFDNLDDDPVPTGPSKSSKSKEASHVSKRRRIDADAEDQNLRETLPRDVLELLKKEIPGGKKDVSPGEFARVWKMSGRKMGNEMVLAQNEYFSGLEKAGSKGGKKKGRGSR